MSEFDKIAALANEYNIKFIDLRFTDTKGKEQHVTIPKRELKESLFEYGKLFDGSSISGWKLINESDMLLVPDATTAAIDPFYQEKTLMLRCDIVDPTTMQGYARDPRSIAKKAELYLKRTGIADVAYFGPEPEFFILDDARWDVNAKGAFYSIDSTEAAWNCGRDYTGGNSGHRPQVKGGYFPVPPVDSSQDIRSKMCLILESMGIQVEAHHHEVASSGQNEIATRYNTLVKKADELQLLKYVVHNVANVYGKTATFMPKPIIGDNGSGMHCHLSLAKNDVNLFAGENLAGLSETALYFIGGILSHAKALNAITNSTTNSYKRLIPGFEAPVILAYSKSNRSAAIRVPHVSCNEHKRIEIRFPDACSNPYLALSALLMAGIDGIKNQIHPGNPDDRNLFDLTAIESKKIPNVCTSLQEALEYLDSDRNFLLAGGVFTHDVIDSYILLKQAEVSRFMGATHPIEFEMYYSL